MSKKILIGIIILLLLSNVYFYWQNQSIKAIISEFKKLNTNENEYQFSIFPIEAYPFGDYCNCNCSFLYDYYNCSVDSSYECENECEDNCNECIKKHNECAEKYNECKDDYKSLIGQIDKILKK